MLPAASSHPTYVLFNNLPRVEDARRFRVLLARRGPMSFGGAAGLTFIDPDAKER